MTARVVVVGANGRVGRAICEGLRGSFEVIPIIRDPEESVESIARRATQNADLVVNAAGVAHVEHPTAADLERLRVGNVELPLTLARWCVERRLPLVHVSSVKAADPRDESPYAASKRQADECLDRSFGRAFADAGLSLTVVRPLAMLLPPFDAGKLARLRWLRHWPAVLTPPLPLPVLTSSTFLSVVDECIGDALGGVASLGFHIRNFDAGERGTVRDVGAAMLASRKG